MDPTLLNNLLASLRNTIFNVLTQNGTPFQQLGQNIFRTVAIVMIVIAGTRIAFSDHHSLHKLRTLAGLVLLVWIMITLYSTPSPLLGGYSFSEVVPRTAFAMADLVGTTTQQQMLAKLNDIMNGIQSMSEFSLLHARDFITYLLITLLIAVLEFAMFIVVGFGYLALGAVLVIGPRGAQPLCRGFKSELFHFPNLAVVMFLVQMGLDAQMPALSRVPVYVTSPRAVSPGLVFLRRSPRPAFARLNL
jgi:hypothetical protein